MLQRVTISSVNAFVSESGSASSNARTKAEGLSGSARRDDDREGCADPAPALTLLDPEQGDAGGAGPHLSDAQVLRPPAGDEADGQDDRNGDDQGDRLVEEVAHQAVGTLLADDDARGQE
jgi:hypothetical protein